MVPPAALAFLLSLAPAASGAGAARSPLPPLADVAALIPDAVLDLRYATPRNITGRPLYPSGARCLLRQDVARRLIRAAQLLRARGFRLRLYDCYRPAAVQRELFAAMPRPGYVADPSRGGSHHGRGAAVDAGLASADGEPVELPTDFDDFSPRARAAAVAGVSREAQAHRAALREAMAAAGFEPSRSEWWHFSAPEAHGAPQVEAPLAPP